MVAMLKLYLQLVVVTLLALPCNDPAHVEMPACINGMCMVCVNDAEHPSTTQSHPSWAVLHVFELSSVIECHACQVMLKVLKLTVNTLASQQQQLMHCLSLPVVQQHNL
jgi:hypothetical protein